MAEMNQGGGLGRWDRYAERKKEKKKSDCEAGNGLAF